MLKVEVKWTHLSVDQSMPAAAVAERGKFFNPMCLLHYQILKFQHSPNPLSPMVGPPPGMFMPWRRCDPEPRKTCSAEGREEMEAPLAMAKAIGSALAKEAKADLQRGSLW
jgi:hypothetical protein